MANNTVKGNISGSTATPTDVAIGSLVATFPPGYIGMFGMTSLPAGWLLCNGASVSTSTYAALFAAIGYSFGGTGASFNLPNFQGYFPRGQNSTGAGPDPSRTFGSTQTDAMQGHYHSPLGGSSGFFGNPGGPGVIQLGSGNATVLSTTSGSPTTDTTNGTPRTATETRPSNVAVAFAIHT
jgi:microcystin-dependent protein